MSGQAGGSRLEVLDGLRFLAAFAVLAYHFTAMDRVWLHKAEDLFPAQPAAYGWLGVYLFFLISGFVICMSAWGRGVGAFLTSRVVRLYPAYWLSVVVIVVVLAFWPNMYRHADLGDALVNLTMFHEPLGATPVAEVYWTLWAELRFYLMFSLLVWWGLTYRRVVGFGLGWLAAVTATKAFVPDGTLLHQVLMSDYAPLFTGGIGCYLLFRFGSRPLSWALVAGSFVLSVPAARFRAGLEADPGEVVSTWPAVALLAVCFLLVLAVALRRLDWVRGRWLVVLGATTYPLYLLHMDVGGTLLNRLHGTMPPALLVALVTVAMVALAWLVHRYVERPVAPLLRRALRRPAKDRAPSLVAVGR